MRMAMESVPSGRRSPKALFMSRDHDLLSVNISELVKVLAPVAITDLRSEDISFYRMMRNLIASIIYKI